MIDDKGGDSSRTIIVYFTLSHVLCIDLDGLSWEWIGSALTNANIKRKCLSKVLSQTRSSLRPPDWKRFTSSQKPSRKPQVRDSDNMIGVKMSEKQTVDIFWVNVSLGQTNYDTAATIEQQLLSRYFDKNC
jgi:hypothetical protein